MLRDWVQIDRSENGETVTVPCHKHTDTSTLLFRAGQAIEKIMLRYPPPYYLMVSGGIDSQAMLYAWLQYGENFVPVSFTYNKTMNSHDLTTLDQFAKIHGVNVIKQDLDVLEFYQSGEYVSYVEKYRCGSPHICTYMKMSDMMPNEGTVIFSGEPLHKGNVFVDRNNWRLFIYSEDSGRSVIPFFFLTTQELAQPTVVSHNDTKKSLYVKNGFPVLTQENLPPFYRLKYTGFEQYKDYYEENFKHLVNDGDYRFRAHGQTSKKVYDVLLRNKYEYKFRHDIYNVTFRRQE